MKLNKIGLKRFKILNKDLKKETIRFKKLFKEKMTKISVVVPVYNESKNIKDFLKRLINTLENIGLDFEIIFALDPSKDDSENILKNECIKNKKIKLIIFSRRFGQPSATMAAINYISGDRCVIIDCDLQDPPELYCK